MIEALKKAKDYVNQLGEDFEKANKVVITRGVYSFIITFHYENYEKKIIIDNS